jgi:hypothetical protein
MRVCHMPWPAYPIGWQLDPFCTILGLTLFLREWERKENGNAPLDETEKQIK